ncbi:RagB/SusD family nutrient uptake outer membrane protein [Archangium lipolyticum]|uniref:RagB/SusD family nutrient uptake outer membrane protein n=1 Tax=Archangium lipolyticum TaxID=2970465 RepID=UPI00214A64DF|nr:RagB/SusD family nutrient uptake outer membrane protein [Archangium lipolyticum]
MKIRNMKKMTKVALALCATMGLGGCGLEVPDLNRPSVESLEETPTRSGVMAAATGLLVDTRTGMATQNGYVALLGVLGREAYVMDTADPRYIGEMLAGSGLDPGSPAFGGSFWTNPYASIRDANTLLNALDKVAGVTDAEKEAIRGFAKTIQALDFLAVINTRDTNGAVIDVNRKLGEPLAPIEPKEKVLEHIAGLLDQAKGHLAAGGEEFPFPLSSGFEDFYKPDTKPKPITVKNFIKVNRALKARVDVYRQDWPQALIDLSESFITDDPKLLDLGVYHAFGTGSGDTQNQLNDADIFAHPSIITDAEKQADGTTPDARVVGKVKKADKPRTWQEVTAEHVFTHYPTDTSKLPIIRNEELLLLRAEANLQLNDLEAALDDINLIRVNSGKLAPITETLGKDLMVNELLKQRRYSLLFEGGHRWIDMRRYNKLGELPLDVAGHRVHEAFPIPIAETKARQPQP